MKPYYEHAGITIYHGDCREILPQLEGQAIQCVVTSPPYWGLRDYGNERQMGLERTPAEYVSGMTAVFAAVRRVLLEDGTLWLNMGDCYATGAGMVGECPGGGEQGDRWKGYRGTRSNEKSDGKHGYIREAMGPMVQPNRMPLPGLKPKDLVGMPWRLAFALQAEGWYLRSDIIWHKPNPMPESVTDRPTKAHEYIFLMSKAERYCYNQEATLEECSPNTHKRLAQNIEAQIGSERANGGQKTNGNMKAVGRKLASAGSGNRSNESFSNAVCLQVEKRNKRSVWTVPTGEGLGDHTSTFPAELIKPCILAGCPPGGIVLDPFCGTGTTLETAKENGCQAWGIEIEEKYCEIAAKRLSQEVLQFV